MSAVNAGGNQGTVPGESSVCVGDGTTCAECGKVFTHSFYFSTHISTHVNQKGFVAVGQCAFCGLVFSNQSIFAAHLISSQARFEKQVSSQDDSGTASIVDLPRINSKQNSKADNGKNYSTAMDDKRKKEHEKNSSSFCINEEPIKSSSTVPSSHVNAAPTKNSSTVPSSHVNAAPTKNSSTVPTLRANTAPTKNSSTVPTLRANTAATKSTPTVSSPHIDEAPTKNSPSVLSSCSNEDSTKISSPISSVHVNKGPTKNSPSVASLHIKEAPTKNSLPVNSGTESESQIKRKRKAPERFEADPGPQMIRTPSDVDPEVEAYLLSLQKMGLPVDPAAFSSHKSGKRRRKSSSMHVGEAMDVTPDIQLLKKPSPKYEYFDSDDSFDNDPEVLPESGKLTRGQRLQQRQERLSQIKEEGKISGTKKSQVKSGIKGTISSAADDGSEKNLHKEGILSTGLSVHAIPKEESSNSGSSEVEKNRNNQNSALSQINKLSKTSSLRAPPGVYPVSKNIRYRGSRSPTTNKKRKTSRPKAVAYVSETKHETLGSEQQNMGNIKEAGTHYLGSVNVQKSSSLEDLKRNSREDVEQMLLSVGMMAFTASSTMRSKPIETSSMERMTRLPSLQQTRVSLSPKQPVNFSACQDYDSRTQFFPKLASGRAGHKNMHTNPVSSLQTIGPAQRGSSQPRAAGHNRKRGIQRAKAGHNSGKNSVNGRNVPNQGSFTYPVQFTEISRGGTTATYARARPQSEVIVTNNQIQAVSTDITGDAGPLLGPGEAQVEGHLKSDTCQGKKSTCGHKNKGSVAILDVDRDVKLVDIGIIEDKTQEGLFPPALCSKMEDNEDVEKPSSLSAMVEIEHAASPKACLRISNRNNLDSNKNVPCSSKSVSEDVPCSSKSVSEDVPCSSKSVSEDVGCKNNITEDEDITAEENIDGWKVSLAENSDSNDGDSASPQNSSPNKVHHLAPLENPEQSHVSSPHVSGCQTASPTHFEEMQKSSVSDKDLLEHHAENMANPKPESYTGVGHSPDMVSESETEKQFQNISVRNRPEMASDKLQDGTERDSPMEVIITEEQALSGRNEKAAVTGMGSGPLGADMKPQSSEHGERLQDKVIDTNSPSEGNRLVLSCVQTEPDVAVKYDDDTDIADQPIIHSDIFMAVKCTILDAGSVTVGKEQLVVPGKKCDKMLPVSPGASDSCDRSEGSSLERDVNKTETDSCDRSEGSSLERDVNKTETDSCDRSEGSSLERDVNKTETAAERDGIEEGQYSVGSENHRILMESFMSSTCTSKRDSWDKEEADIVSENEGTNETNTPAMSENQERKETDALSPVSESEAVTGGNETDLSVKIETTDSGRDRMSISSSVSCSHDQNSEISVNTKSLPLASPVESTQQVREGNSLLDIFSEIEKTCKEMVKDELKKIVKDQDKEMIKDEDTEMVKDEDKEKMEETTK